MKNDINFQHKVATEEVAEPPVRVALLSIIGVWLFYGAIATLRAWVMEFPSPGELAVRRIIVMIAGVLLTVGLWALLRLIAHFSMRQKIVAITLLAIPFAFASSATNYYAFNIYDPMNLLASEKARIPIDLRPTVLQEITETAISRYFLIIAWAAFYIAMGLAERTKRVERRAAELAKAAQTAELRALRYQVNPHFLFNTLNSLSALVLNNRRDEAETMIMNLSNFYRTSLAGEPTEDVTLAEEIELQQLYLDIEKVRFPSRLSVDIDLPAQLQDVLVPGLILQPLVENAVKHGVSAATSEVVIRILARQENGRIIIDVCDTGASGKSGSRGNGIGLTNVRDRLFARYGDKASLVVGPGKDGGFCVTLDIPDGQDGTS